MTIWLFIVTVLLSVVSIEQCYWGFSPYIYFGGKTLYDDVRGDIRKHETQLTGCKQASLWMLARHGTRNPSEPNIREMKTAMALKRDILLFHSEGLGELWEKDMEQLEKWKWNPEIDKAPYALTTRGYRELKELGSRINETFFTLLRRLNVHTIRPTNEQRTVESANSFVDGLDPELGYQVLAPLEKNKDFMLLPFKNCELHTKEAWNGFKRERAIQRYTNSSEYKQLLENIQRRIGFQETLTVANVTGLYDLCRFNRAFSENASSPWCKLFSVQDLQVLEYMEDLNHYYRSGYGIPHNEKLGRLVLADLLKKFQAVVYNSKPTFTAYFSHDSLIDMVYCALGVFRDEEGISASWRNPFRKWKSSLISPFAANILVVLHNCKDSSNPRFFKVQFFANERPLKVCEHAICSWTEFEDKLKPFLDSNLDFCKYEDSLV